MEPRFLPGHVLYLESTTANYRANAELMPKLYPPVIHHVPAIHYFNFPELIICLKAFTAIDNEVQDPSPFTSRDRGVTEKYS